MTEKLHQTIREEIATLPIEKQGVINASGWEKISEEIGKSNSLDETEINNLQIQILLVLIGLELLENFPRNIEVEVELSGNEAVKIASQVQEKIFKPVVERLESLAKDKAGNATVVKNVDFITSGGDYSVFLDQSNNSGEEQKK